MNWKNNLNWRILIVDDSIESLQLLAQYLKESFPECIVYQTNNPLKAIEIAQEEIPDLIISDWDMPHKNGIELVKQLKTIESVKNIPVIIITGINCESFHLKDALNAGAIDFIRKPIDPVELNARIQSLLVLNNEQKDLIKIKEHELVHSALNLEKSNEFLLKLGGKLKHFVDTANLNKSKEKYIEELIELIDEKTSINNWHQFELFFESIHANFINTLLMKFPDLSLTELKICVFIKLNISIKNIASILHQKPESIKVSRSRIRKKMGLEQRQNLSAYLMQY